MSKSRNFVNEDSYKQQESPSHKKRREEQQKLKNVRVLDDWEEEEHEDTFEPLPKRDRVKR